MKTSSAEPSVDDGLEYSLLYELPHSHLQGRPAAAAAPVVNGELLQGCLELLQLNPHVVQLDCLHVLSQALVVLLHPHHT